MFTVSTPPHHHPHRFSAPSALVAPTVVARGASSRRSALVSSECFKPAGVCYFLGSFSGFASIVTTVIAIANAPTNQAYGVTTAFLGFSYVLKLPYYVEKKLAFLINALMAVGWTCVFVYAFVAYEASRR
jgi:hypothetical protein